jgi:hypothetical protein
MCYFLKSSTVTGITFTGIASSTPQFCHHVHYLLNDPCSQSPNLSEKKTMFSCSPTYFRTKIWTMNSAMPHSMSKHCPSHNFQLLHRSVASVLKSHGSDTVNYSYLSDGLISNSMHDNSKLPTSLNCINIIKALAYM